VKIKRAFEKVIQTMNSLFTLHSFFEIFNKKKKKTILLLHRLRQGIW